MIDSPFEKNASNEGNVQKGVSSLQKSYLCAIKLLTKKDYSEYKLSQKLLLRGFSPEDINATIDQLKIKNLLREDDYCELKIKGMMQRNYSPEYILASLSREKINISKEQIEKIFWDHKVTSKIQIKKIFEKKLRNLTSISQKDINRALNRALSKGHSLALAKECIATYTTESEDY